MGRKQDQMLGGGPWLRFEGKEEDGLEGELKRKGHWLGGNSSGKSRLSI